ncbi:NTP transferase domain-containing protein [Leucobacter luti]|nr:NTP transferase domain-containing protein [Leucobacter luti]
MGQLDAILFAGGRGSRLGGVDKAELRLGGARLVDRVVAGARAAGAHRIVVVGPAHVVPAGCRAAREDPPFGDLLPRSLPRLRRSRRSTGPRAPGQRCCCPVTSCIPQRSLTGSCGSRWGTVRPLCCETRTGEGSGLLAATGSVRFVRVPPWRAPRRAAGFAQHWRA